jgi:hypothetical protein
MSSTGSFSGQRVAATRARKFAISVSGNRAVNGRTAVLFAEDSVADALVVIATMDLLRSVNG